MKIGFFGSLKQFIKPYDVNHIAIWKMQETSGTTVSDTKGTYPLIATAGTLITSNDFGGYARQFDGGLHYLYHSTNPIIPATNKTIRFKIKANTNPAPVYVVMENYNATATGIEIIIVPTGKIQISDYVSGANRGTVISTFAITNGIEYDIQYTSTGNTTANGVKQYIKALTGANAGKWIDSSDNYVSNITTNAQITLSGNTVSGVNGLFIGTKYDGNYKLSGAYLYDVQVSNVIRYSMEDYV